MLACLRCYHQKQALSSFIVKSYNDVSSTELALSYQKQRPTGKLMPNSFLNLTHAYFQPPKFETAVFILLCRILHGCLRQKNQ
jgi:hypothetical protein